MYGVSMCFNFAVHDLIIVHDPMLIAKQSHGSELFLMMQLQWNHVEIVFNLDLVPFSVFSFIQVLQLPLVTTDALIGGSKKKQATPLALNINNSRGCYHETLAKLVGIFFGRTAQTWGIWMRFVAICGRIPYKLSLPSKTLGSYEGCEAAEPQPQIRGVFTLSPLLGVNSSW